MASALQKLLRKSPSTRFITSLRPSQAPNPSNPIVALHRECHRPTPPTSTPEDEGLENSRAVWADSVKKKRKRKMNKHKYQKLRKRMRRQT